MSSKNSKTIFILLIIGISLTAIDSLDHETVEPIDTINTNSQGKTQPVTFTISDTTVHEDIAFIDIKDSNITAVLFKKPPESLSKGKQVEAIATVTRYHGTPEIIIQTIKDMYPGSQSSDTTR